MTSKELKKQGLEFLEKYKSLGYIVDIYSDEWVNSQDPDEYYAISREDLERFDSEKGTEYRGHLLAVYLGDKNPELFSDLRRIYKPFNDYCNIETTGIMALIYPSLLLINLRTREILCVGLGYKNRIFSFELSRYMHSQANSLGKDFGIECSDDFDRLDHNNVIRNVLKTTEQLGELYYEYDSLKGNSDVIVTLQDDGLFYLDDYDEEGMTIEEVNELRNDYEKYSEWIDDCISDLKAYFPKIDVWDLNSGAYL
jgi:hypothetical protein